MNNAGVKNRRVLGFVDLRPRQYTFTNQSLMMGYLRIVSSMPSLFWSNKALNHARNDGTSSCDTSCGRAATFFTIPGSTTFCSQVNEHLCSYGGKAYVRSTVPGQKWQLAWYVAITHCKKRTTSPRCPTAVCGSPYHRRVGKLSHNISWRGEETTNQRFRSHSRPRTPVPPR